MSKSQKFLESIQDTLPHYIVYYMDNDGQKKVVEKGLSYQQAVKYCQVHSKEYGTDLKYQKDSTGREFL
jgi:hypothetical protein